MKRATLFLAPIAAALFVTACGSTTPPVEKVPALSGPLERLDAAVVASDYRDARIAIRDLKHLASEARTSGSLSMVQAQEIIAAVTSVASDLRDLQPSHDPATSPTPQESPPDDQGDKQDEDQDQDKTKDKHKDDEEPGKSDDAPGHNKDD